MDINLFRKDKGGDPEIVRESQRKRFADVNVVDEIIELDKEWISAKYELDQKRKTFGTLNKTIAQKKKAGENADGLIEESKALDAEVKKLQERENELKTKLDDKISNIGNLVHESVVVSNDEIMKLSEKLGISDQMMVAEPIMSYSG